MPEWRKEAKVRRAQRIQERQIPRLQPTHFLCLPLITETSREPLTKALERFRTEAKQLSGLDQSVKDLLDQRSLRPVGTLHLTLGVMSLPTQERVDESIQAFHQIDLSSLLNEASEQAKRDSDYPSPGESLGSVCSEPLKVSLNSIEAMGPTQKTRVLYVEPRDASKRLRPFCIKLQEAFVERELMIKENRPLKLHLTILNTIYAKPSMRNKRFEHSGRDPETPKRAEQGRGADDEAPQSKEEEDDNALNEAAAKAQGENSKVVVSNFPNPQRRGPLSFDSTPLLDAFREFEWVPQMQLSRLAICKMGATKILDDSGEVVDEAYEEVATRQLPT